MDGRHCDNCRALDCDGHDVDVTKNNATDCPNYEFGSYAERLAKENTNNAPA